MLKNINLLFFIIPAAYTGKNCGNCSNLEQNKFRRCLKSAVKSQHNCIKKCNIFNAFILCTEFCIDGFKRKIERCPCVKGKRFISNAKEPYFERLEIGTTTAPITDSDLTSEHAQLENEKVTKIPDHIYDKIPKDCEDRIQSLYYNWPKEAVPFNEPPVPHTLAPTVSTLGTM